MSIARSVPAMRNTPSAYSMSAAALSNASAARSCAFCTVRCDATCTAEPPTNSEREPALPKPVPRSVSPNATRMRSIGTPNTSTASCAKVVPSEVPIGCVALKISMPCSSTVTVTLSVNTSAPVHSRNVVMPRPRRRPRCADAACRAAKPFQSACASPRSSTRPN